MDIENGKKGEHFGRDLRKHVLGFVVARTQKHELILDNVLCVGDKEILYVNVDQACPFKVYLNTIYCEL